MRSGHWLAAALLMTMPMLARAQDSAASVAATPAASLPGAATPIDPTRLAAARRTVDFVFPQGTYARIMGQSMQAIMGSAMDGIGAMPLRDLAAAGGVKPEEVARLGQTTIREMMTIIDPAYDRRMQVMAKVMTQEMAGMMTEIEPGMREGLTRAYARRFDAAQLGDLNRFFASPTGRAYAADAMVIFADPEVMAQMQNFVPVLMKRMPAMMQRVQQASADLPKIRTIDQLSPAERQRLMDLTGSPAATDAADGTAPKG